MIFEALNEAADKGELLLVENGLCRFHKRRDGSVTIREIIVLPRCRGYHIGRCLLARVELETRPTMLVARCPVDLESNAFWLKVGFTLDRVEPGKRRKINVWVRPCAYSAPTVIQPSQSVPLPVVGSTEQDCQQPCTSVFSLPIRTGNTPTVEDT